MYSRLVCRAAIPAALTAARPAHGAPAAGAGARLTGAARGTASDKKNAATSPSALLTRPQQGVSLTGTQELFFSAWRSGLRHPQAFSGRGESSTSSRGLSTQEGEDRTGGGGKGTEKNEAEEELQADKRAERDEEVVVALKEELAKSEEQLKDTKEKALYLAAEMENVRAIAKRDANGARLYAVQQFAKQLLDVADNLERAVVSAKEAEEGGGDSSHDVLLQGVEMTSDELRKVFCSQGLEKYGERGDKFDPHLHDAMFAYRDPAQEPGTVGQVLKCGYKLHDRVIRAAQVGTVKDA